MVTFEFEEGKVIFVPEEAGGEYTYSWVVFNRFGRAVHEGAGTGRQMVCKTTAANIIKDYITAKKIVNEPRP
jgi:hypothetical protein